MFLQMFCGVCDEDDDTDDNDKDDDFIKGKMPPKVFLSIVTNQDDCIFLQVFCRVCVRAAGALSSRVPVTRCQCLSLRCTIKSLAYV